MAHRVCPPWIGYFLLSPIRRWGQGDPNEILRPYVREGMTVLEPGPGMGFFTLALARLVGPSGRVVAVDIQPRMLASLRRRAARAGLLGRLDVRLVSSDTLGLDDLAAAVDFTQAFAVIHRIACRRAVFRGNRKGLEAGRGAAYRRTDWPCQNREIRGGASGGKSGRVRTGR